MKLSVLISACVATLAVASPHSLEARLDIITRATCKLNAALSPAKPFSPLFPAAYHLGNIVGPLVKGFIGAENEEKIDKLADNLCVNSQEEEPGQRGLCQEALDQANTLAVATLPIQQAKSYRCLLNLLCVAPAGVPTTGTCQTLLRGGDCIANRILQTKDLECL